MLFASLLFLSALLVHGQKHEVIKPLSLVDDCEFDFSASGYKFDLCPLFRGHAHLAGSASWRTLSPPTEMTRELRWNFGGPLARKPDTAETDQCLDGTWICLTETNRRLVDMNSSARVTKLIPIAGKLTASSRHQEHAGHSDEDVIPKSTTADIELSLEDAIKWTPMRDVLRLRVFGGYYNQEPQHALISFLCDEAAQEPTGLEYSHAYNGSHWMTWRTPHACPTHVDPDAAHAPHHPGEDDDERGEVPPEDTFVPDARVRKAWVRASWLGVAALVVAVLVLAQTGRLPALTKRAYPALRALGARHPLRALYARLTLGPCDPAGYSNVDSGSDDTVFDVELDGEGEEGAWVGAEQGNGRRPEATPLSPSRVDTFGVKTYGTR